MYKGRRRVDVGMLLVGCSCWCPVAIGALLLSILYLVMDFWRNMPPGLLSLKVLSRRLALSFKFNRNVDNKDLIVMRVANAYRKLERSIKGQGFNFARSEGKVTSNDGAISKAIADELDADRCSKCNTECPKTCMNHCPRNCADHATSVIISAADITALGVDFSSGKPVSHTKMKERLRTVEIKATKIRALVNGCWN